MTGARLAGKTAIVTGAARGIGRAYALRLAKLGADVVIADLNLQGAARIGEELGAESVMAEIEALGCRSIGVQGDLRNPEAVAGLVAETMAAFGRIDILVNNAGVAVARGSGTLSTDTTPEAFDYLIAANLKSTQMCCAAVAPVMKQQKSGVIVNISSQTGISLLEHGNLAIYGAAKAGVAYLTRTLAAELGPDGIRVNAIAPGIIETARLKKLDPSMGVGTPEQLNAIALRRFGQTEDMANVLEFLATDLSGYVSGQVISACGGAVLHPN
ncbi:3-oxoacyl-[acyl-carrier-protein] reductase FabG [Marinovum algicola]|uniref:3-oxoacyl-[acyl-carrier protein] reductase n=1 Tax=Marinovum algicola TaxID=42444 RepID=A0A975WBV0_9RHOB|nr:SDR family oxidoreductase [Marinovum algicola]SEJ82661.1 3-oxoacyl-[acyl-carrier protein] reductase [Marinovum algicola]SLN62824.1 3-oxoacyl-[acyl-carrier-protein] reductase FabG [Marinovum algicola]